MMMIECIMRIIWICSWNIGVCVVCVRLQIQHRHSDQYRASAQCKFKYNYRSQTLAIICTRCFTDRLFSVSLGFWYILAGFTAFCEAYSSRLNANHVKCRVIDAFDSGIIRWYDISVWVLRSFRIYVALWCVFPFAYALAFNGYYWIFLIFFFQCLDFYFYFRFPLSYAVTTDIDMNESLHELFFFLFKWVYISYPTLTSRLNYFFCRPNYFCLLFNIIRNKLSSKWCAFREKHSKMSYIHLFGIYRSLNCVCLFWTIQFNEALTCSMNKFLLTQVSEENYSLHQILLAHPILFLHKKEIK